MPRAFLSKLFAQEIKRREEIVMADSNGTAAVVTGAGCAIERKIALHQARSGAKVAALARTAGDIDETAPLIGGEGGAAIFLSVDFSGRRVVGHAYVGS
jgi:NADP-dependent 3-hydroxy acid dehydrogenase YdfG